MSRLLFAAARGARVQALDRNLSWIASSHCPLELSNDTRPYRIHWQDEELQYGPVSSALREAAAAGNAWDLTGDIGSMAHAFASYQAVWWMTDDDLTRSLFLLILAENLADLGM